MLAQSIGTFARALDYGKTQQANDKKSVTLSAINACRDTTKLNAFRYLHESGYNLTETLLNLYPAHGVGPLLCKDQFEDWSPLETSIFEEALENYSKDFNEIRNEALLWKSMRSIIEFYYMWKTTDRYSERKRNKETQSRRLTQIYIPA